MSEKLGDLKEEDLQKEINLQLTKSLENYRNTLSYMLGDMPIQSLNIPKKIIKILINNDIIRVYDLFGRDFTKIEGLDFIGIRDLTTCFNEFISMC